MVSAKPCKRNGTAVDNKSTVNNERKSLLINNLTYTSCKTNLNVYNNKAYIALKFSGHVVHNTLNAHDMAIKIKFKATPVEFRPFSIRSNIPSAPFMQPSL